MPEDELTHASFFSGVGGLDLGLERAGWRTVSFSEIDPYACAVLAQRWPAVPNLGDIVQLAGGSRGGVEDRARHGSGSQHQSDDWRVATLWSGGFPCQDLSVAGKRRGMGAGTRSGLAFAFLDLVAVHRPRAVLLENVPGLLSIHGGRDMAALIGALVELGYGVGYRVLDARHFGVPQRRRRVFILGLTPGGRAGAECAAEVLSVGSRCRRHPPTGIEAREAVAERVALSVGHALSVPTSTGRNDPNGEDFIVGPLDTALGHHGAGWPDQSVAAGHLVGSLPDADRMRTPDGLAGRSHDRGGVAVGLQASDGHRGHGSPRDGRNLIAFNPYRTLERDGSVTSSYAPRDVVDALHGPTGNKEPLVMGMGVTADALLPFGLDSHRYRCCGNGVVSSVAEWIGLRLVAYFAEGAA